MIPERYQQVGKLYRAALELSPENRNAFLDEACAGDEELRHEIESLLKYESEADDFLESPAFEVAANIISDSAKKLPVGEKIKHYEIISHIGAGGMGEVYLAEDTTLRRRVALKVLPSIYTDDTERLKRFQTEARAAAALNHPNIATVHTVEEVQGRHFITMEYVEGETLIKRIPQGGVSLSIFFEWFIPLADALIHAHEKGIIHRDIKPGNVIITAEGIPKILDFGLARILRSSETDETLHLTREGIVIGTPAYMSPEQAEGERIDQRSDIFSFGILMYEAVTGQRPFKGDSYASIVSELMKSEPSSVDSFRADIPFLLGRLIRRCLTKNLRQRYQTMREVKTILEEAKAEFDSGVLTIQPKSYKQNKYSFPRFAVVGIIVLAVLFSAFAVWKLVGWNSSETKPIVRFSVTPPTGQITVMSEAMLSPDGQYIVFSSRKGEREQLYLRSLDQFDMRLVAGTEGARRPFFSHDSQWLGFFLDGNKIKKVPVTGGTAVTICDSCKETYEAHWGKGDIIIASDKEGLYRISANGGVPERLTKIDSAREERTHKYPQLLPNGKRIIFVIESNKESKLAALSLENLELSYLQDLGEASVAQYIDSGYLIFTRGKQLLAVRFNPESLKVTGTVTPIFDGVFSNLKFSVASNGTLAYLPDTALRESSLVWVDSEGKESPLLDSRANYRSPRISHDGKHIAVQVDDDIWIYETESGRGVRLTFEGENFSPVWTYDSRNIIFASKRNNVWNILSQSIDGKSETQKLLSSEYRQLPYSISPNGQTLALVSFSKADTSDVVFLSLQDGKTTPYLNSSYVEDVPSFSPDGNWVSYFSMETGKPEVYVQSVSGSGNKIPVSRDGGMFPVWSKNGREIYYRMGNRFYAANISQVKNLTVGTPRVIFEGKYLTSYDVASDGKFLMVKNEGGSLPSQLYIVLNWMDELKRIVP